MTSEGGKIATTDLLGNENPSKKKRIIKSADLQLRAKKAQYFFLRKRVVMEVLAEFF